MKKNDFKGIEKAIKVSDAVVTISMDKRNVRKLVVEMGDDETKVFTSFSLDSVIKKASKCLLEKQNEEMMCVAGDKNIEDGIEWLLTKKFNITITQENDVFDTYKVVVKTKSKLNCKVIHVNSVFQVQGIHELFKQLEDWALVIQENTVGINKQ